MNNQQLSKEWFRKAYNDLSAAKIIISAEIEKKPYDTVCFHSQQAVEKFLKGFLTYHNKNFPKSHFLEMLLELCKEIDLSFEDIAEIGMLTPYSVEIRYPDNTDEIEAEEAEEAYQLALKVKQFIENKIN
ncbi:MAG: DNA-binding protein [Bacteroidetes bacterium]|nr:MAG: DNA-binding protein [Bacteroidota bacterium]RLD84233.1 MAG: DNA-binding protein [Bacteroidota bacterium]